MTHRLIHRAFSFALAAVLTLGMLGGIDTLSSLDDASPQWAQQTSSTQA